MARLDWGSSPRVRGEAWTRGASMGRTGIIPAGAGRSVSAFEQDSTRRDHPRGCGEKRLPRPPCLKRMGSSPRVRGEVVFVELVGLVAGIIPAGAGRSLRAKAGMPANWDHPRGCGEKALIADLGRGVTGSSPRVRGEGEKGRLGEHLGGIIPAGAGRSHDGHGRVRRHGDHPRGCGEKASPRICGDPRVGSSPRVRGEANPSTPPQSIPWIIPAGAGRRTVTLPPE